MAVEGAREVRGERGLAAVVGDVSAGLRRHLGGEGRESGLRSTAFRSRSPTSEELSSARPEADSLGSWPRVSSIQRTGAYHAQLAPWDQQVRAPSIRCSRLAIRQRGANRVGVDQVDAVVAKSGLHSTTGV